MVRAQNVSPWRENNDPQQPIVGAAVLRFFDKHLSRRNTAIEGEKPVHYFTMGEEKWKASDTWPPAAEDFTLYPAPSRELATTRPVEEGTDVYQGDYACGTGMHSRYDRLYIQNVETYYDDWDGREDLMLSYTSDPLDMAMEVTGHPWVGLHFAASEKDCSFFAYIADVTPEGKSLYVTEGVFRALHRKPGAHPDKIPETGPTHSFRQVDAQLLVPGEPAEARFELLPTSYLFQAGASHTVFHCPVRFGSFHPNSRWASTRADVVPCPGPGIPARLAGGPANTLGASCRGVAKGLIAGARCSHDTLSVQPLLAISDRLAGHVVRDLRPDRPDAR